jgi:hypothetical protein
MILISVLGIYGRVKTAAAAIEKKLDENVLPTEILQRIAEDLDRLASPGFDTKITLKRKLDPSGYELCQLIIQNAIYDKNDKARTFERILWQSAYDYFEDAIIIYRSYGGIALEDKVITDQTQRQRQELGAELLVPLCTGVTFLRIEPPGTIKNSYQWSKGKLPKSLTVSISFAQPFESIAGRLDVEEYEKFTRTIAIDRTRKIRYVFIRKEFETLPEPNELDDYQWDDTPPEDDQSDIDEAETEDMSSED